MMNITIKRWFKAFRAWVIVLFFLLMVSMVLGGVMTLVHFLLFGR